MRSPTPGISQQFGRAVAHLAALAMEGHGKAVGFVANQLHQVQHRRMVIEHDRFIFLPVHVDDFFALGDRRQRLIDDLERFQCLGSGMQLAEAAVDQHQARHCLLFFLQTLVTARDHLAHGGKVVHAIDAANDELAVVGLLHWPSSQTTIEATVSAPWICEMSKHSMRRGSSGTPSASCNAS